ncbi:polyhydroxyalkanoic acid system family protein [Desulfonatronovibrio magnus]|uniref:polyhydroxyalkanoic acid system family protein n=1 Tax=Desulfonatronovibrio magnus TaxID=698827 RepID=UPI0005EB636F|nr:polyhydroxyalkanoic acid system family protein [Desulfonatronovibrio magnus]
MPHASIVVKTPLNPDTVLKRIQYLADDLLKEHGTQVITLHNNLDSENPDVTLNIGGYTLHGRLFIYSGWVELNVKYPWTASIYKNKIKQEVHEILYSLLNGDT